MSLIKPRTPLIIKVNTCTPSNISSVLDTGDFNLQLYNTACNSETNFNIQLCFVVEKQRLMWAPLLKATIDFLTRDMGTAHALTAQMTFDLVLFCFTE